MRILRINIRNIGGDSVYFICTVPSVSDYMNCTSESSYYMLCTSTDGLIFVRGSGVTGPYFQ